MPGRLKVRIVAGRHLPVMDRASELTDAFVEVKFATVTYKTEVFTKSLNPMWDSEWFKFEVDDELLQDEPLQIRVLDYDTYSSHDPIGKVYIDIDPLLDPASSHSLCGWFPIYDTMHGIRGEILIIVRLELFADVNQFKQSSCGFKFICGTNLPEYYQITQIFGFVHELIINEDPEYKWIDKLRTPRSTNEARQRLFSKMSGELQRHIGSKVENLGGNAVIGYLPSFDIEGESGVVARGIGTAATIIIKPHKHEKSELPPNVESLRRSSSSHFYTSTIKPTKLNQSLPSELVVNQEEKKKILKSQQNNFKFFNEGHNTLQDYPFYTLHSFPSGFIVRLSVIVTTRSVKILEKIHNQDELETRDLWWAELRQEMKSHCEALACNAVLGYIEHTTICDEVIILSAQGTAAVVNNSYFNQALNEENSEFLDPDSPTFSKNNSSFYSVIEDKSKTLKLFQAPLQLAEQICPVTFQPSPIDLKTPVPVIYMSTINLPVGVKNIGKGTLIQARFCRSKKKCQSETNAALVSDILPFVEYELHKQLHNKLKLYRMNAIFGLDTRITLGENLVVGVATGTMVYLDVLPKPSEESLNLKTSGFKALMIKKQQNFNKRSKEIFQLDLHQEFESLSDSSEDFSTTSLNSPENISLTSESKKSIAIGIEDLEEEEDLNLLMEDQFPPPNCNITNLDVCPGGCMKDVDVTQTFSYLWRVKYDDEAGDKKLNQGLRSSFNNALSSVWFHLLRKSKVCQLTSIRFNVAIPDDDELQIWITGTLLTPTELENRSSSLTSSKGQFARSKSLSDELSNVYKNTKTLSLHTTKTSPKKQSSVEDKDILFHTTSSTKLTPQTKEIFPKIEDPTTPNKDPFHVSIAENRASISLANKSTSPMFHKIKRANTMNARFRNDSGSKSRSRYYSDSSAYSVQHLEINAADDIRKCQVQTVPMSYIPGKVILRHIGLLNMFIIRETTAVRGSEEEILMAEPSNGTGCSWFVSRSLAETQAIIRSHVVALGGNCLTSYRLCSCVLDERVTKNEAQCLLHVTGDIVVTSS